MNKFRSVSLMEYDSSKENFLDALKTAAIFFALFYIFALVQIALAFPVVLIAFSAVVLTRSNRFSSFAAAVSAGLVFDLFSQYPFGFWVVVFLIFRFLIVMMMNSYVRFPLFFKR